MWRGTICAAVLLGAAWAVYGQPAESNLKFEVASVKQSPPGTEGARIQFLPGGTFRATNVPLIYLLQEIYQLRSFQIMGDRRWMSIVADGYNSRYDIEAKSSIGADEAQLRAMVRGLLAERFQLAVHTETRELPVYTLAPAKGGAKLPQAKNDGKTPGSGRAGFPVAGWIQGTNVAMPALIQALSELVDRPVLDKTGFTEAFDFKLTFTPDWDSATPSDGTCPSSFARFREQRKLKPEIESCPSIFTAVQDQLGLKLDPQKAPVVVLVVDHVERPSAN